MLLIRKTIACCAATHCNPSHSIIASRYCAVAAQTRSQPEAEKTQDQQEVTMPTLMLSLARQFKQWLDQGNGETLLESFLITAFLTLALISGMAILMLE
jgi:hypothetical protein